MAVEREELEHDIESANERAIEKMRKSVRGEPEEKPEPERRAKPEPEPEEDEDEELDLSDDEEGDESDAEPEPERASRKERRQNRLRAIQEERDAAREEAAASRRAYEALLEAQEQRQPERQVAAPPAQQRDYDAEYEALWEEQQKVADYGAMLQERAARNGQTLAPEEYDKLVRHARSLEQRRQQVMFEKFQAASAPQQQQPAARQQATHPVVQATAAEFPDVFSDMAAKTHVKAAYLRMLREGKPDNPATLRQAALEARERVLGVKPASRAAPTAQARAKYTGSSSGGGTAARTGERPANIVVMTKEMKKMADAAFGHIEDDKTRWKHWAKNVGVKSMSDAVKDKRR